MKNPSPRPLKPTALTVRTRVRAGEKDDRADFTVKLYSETCTITVS